MFDGSLATAPSKPAKLLESEKALRSAHTEYAQLAKRQRDLGVDVDGNVKAIVAVEAERRALIDQIGSLRRQVVEQQAAHGEKVRKALAPAIAAATHRALVAAVDLQVALQGLDELNEELRENHSPEVLVLMPDLAPLIARLGHLAG